MKVVVCLKGGKGSGFHGHSGRPGMVGGSTSGPYTDFGMVWSKIDGINLESKNKELIANTVVTPKQKKALKNYKYGDMNNGYIAINSVCRGQQETLERIGVTDEDVENINKAIVLMDEAIAQNTIGEDIVVYRGVDVDFPVTIGMTFTDKGFASTSFSANRPLNLSKSPGDAPQGSIFRIALKQGSNALPMDGIVKGMYEYEILLPRGGTFTVVRDVTAEVRNYLSSGKMSDPTLPKVYEVIYEQ